MRRILARHRSVRDDQGVEREEALTRARRGLPDWDRSRASRAGAYEPRCNRFDELAAASDSVRALDRVCIRRQAAATDGASAR